MSRQSALIAPTTMPSVSVVSVVAQPKSAPSPPKKLSDSEKGGNSLPADVFYRAEAERAGSGDDAVGDGQHRSTVEPHGNSSITHGADSGRCPAFSRSDHARHGSRGARRIARLDVLGA